MVFIKQRHFSLPLAALLVTLFAAETYTSSGWKTLRFIEQFKPSTLRQANATPKTAPSSKGLRNAIARNVSCIGRPDQQIRSQNSQPAISIWLSPYRQFPEVAAEGDQRSKGDYEYFGYIGNKICGKSAINYGAFKGSPADRIFNRASSQGLRAELLLSMRLGYTIFALDTRKIWLSASDADHCNKQSPACTKTDDGFLAIHLKDAKELTKNPSFLVDSRRIGIGATLAESLESISLNTFNRKHWHGWESPSPDSAIQWSKDIKDNIVGADILAPLIGESVPSNLRIYLHANASLGQLTLALNCKDGKAKILRLATQGKKDVTKDFTTCKPNRIFLIDALDKSGRSATSSAPHLSTSDQRKSFYGIEFRVDTGSDPA